MDELILSDEELADIRGWLRDMQGQSECAREHWMVSALYDDRTTLVAEVKRLEAENRHLDFTRVSQQVALAKAEDARDAAVARVAEMEGAWVPVGERLPEDGRTVLICREPIPGNLRVLDGCRYKNAWYNSGGKIDRVTHWRELPPAPTPP